VTGVLVRREDGSPLLGRTFRVYQADTTGDPDAREPADERTARLAADLVTDASGHLRIRTVVPGR
jgi:protocatechuate 3,4-dioxygenase beta subunit